MKKIKFFAVVAFLAAVASAFMPPPPAPWGKNASMVCVSGGTIVGADNCDIQEGSQCKVMIGSGSTAVNSDAFSDQVGCNTADDNKRLRRPQ